MSTPVTIALDVYGTLVDPMESRFFLRSLLGPKAPEFAELWHRKKLEYAFRRGLMQKYKDFTFCTRQALLFCIKHFDLELSEDEQDELLVDRNNVAAFPDVIPGLEALKSRGHTLVAFSNGPKNVVKELAETVNVATYLDDVVSVDDVRTFKPDPLVYHHLVACTRSTKKRSWLVSSNPWDVIGAKSAGLRAVWVKRNRAQIFDPWDVEPDLVITDLFELSKYEFR